VIVDTILIGQYSSASAALHAIATSFAYPPGTATLLDTLSVPKNLNQWTEWSRCKA
jgi:hypothetical protein